MLYCSCDRGFTHVILTHVVARIYKDLYMGLGAFILIKMVVWPRCNHISVNVIWGPIFPNNFQILAHCAPMCTPNGSCQLLLVFMLCPWLKRTMD